MLTIKRPTSTTVLYTVSTSPAIKTVTVRLQIIILTLLRLLLGTQVLLILWQEAQTHSRTVAGYDSPFSDTAPGRLAILVTEKLRWQFVLPICAAVAWVITRRGYTEESLLVIRGLGVQTSTSSPSYLSAASTRFIPTNMIQDIFIYEAFKGFEVKFYLAIVVEREQDVVVVFPVGAYHDLQTMVLIRLEHTAQETALGRGLARCEGLLV